MQTEKMTEYKSSAEVIDFKAYKSGLMAAKTSFNKSEETTCFRTDERYFCHDRDCVRWNDCQQLIAEWLR